MGASILLAVLDALGADLETQFPQYAVRGSLRDAEVLHAVLDRDAGLTHEAEFELLRCG